jgi:tetratricopeptide (TPR) repeat protein
LNGKEEIFMNKILIISFLILTATFVFGQEYEQKLYEFYVEGDMGKYGQLLRTMEKELDRSSNEGLFLLVQTQFIYSSYLMEEDEDEAEKWIEKSWPMAESLKANKFKTAQVLAMEGSMYGFMTSINPWKVMTYGPKSIEYLDKAIETNPNCPIAWLYYGNADFYRPEIFGGSKTEALNKYKKAYSLLEERDVQKYDQWKVLNTLVMMGQAYEALDEPSLAKEYYQMALEIEPDFDWVKNTLLPELN